MIASRKDLKKIKTLRQQAASGVPGAADELLERLLAGVTRVADIQAAHLDRP